MNGATGYFAVTLDIGIFLVAASLVLGFFRLARGPSFSDRVIALDMMTISIVAFCALFAIRTGASAYFDIAAVLALIGFLATVAFARFAERGLHRRGDMGTYPTGMIGQVAARKGAEDGAPQEGET